MLEITNSRLFCIALHIIFIIKITNMQNFMSPKQESHMLKLLLLTKKKLLIASSYMYGNVEGFIPLL